MREFFDKSNKPQGSQQNFEISEIELQGVSEFRRKYVNELTETLNPKNLIKITSQLDHLDEAALKNSKTYNEFNPKKLLPEEITIAVIGKGIFAEADSNDLELFARTFIQPDSLPAIKEDIKKSFLPLKAVLAEKALENPLIFSTLLMGANFSTPVQKIIDLAISS